MSLSFYNSKGSHTFAKMYVPGIATCLYLDVIAVSCMYNVYTHTLVMEFRACVLREGMQK